MEYETEDEQREIARRERLKQTIGISSVSNAELARQRAQFQLPPSRGVAVKPSCVRRGK